MTRDFEKRVAPALSPGFIALNEIREGTVVFSIPESTGSCKLKIVNNEGDVISNIVELSDIPAV